MALRQKSIFHFQAHTQGHFPATQWLDRSPYAFQNWYKPSPPQAIYATSLFCIDDAHDAYDVNPSSNKIQPLYNQNRLCAAVQFLPSLQIKWVTIPCDQVIPCATFVCERKIPSGLGFSKTGRFISMSYKECPRRTIAIKNACLFVVNYTPTKADNPENACYARGMGVFLLPYFLVYRDLKLIWLTWNHEDIFILQLFISMTHRWSTVYGDNSENMDVIIGARQASQGYTRMVGLKYSETYLVHVRSEDMHDNFSSTSLYALLCHHPMNISNGMCLSGHATCNDGTCIVSHYMCDGRPDCPDASDELECNHVCTLANHSSANASCFFSCTSPECLCHDLYFSCTLGGCVPWSRVCNGVPDCPRGEDEQRCFFGDESSKMSTLFLGSIGKYKLQHEPKENMFRCMAGPNISQSLVNDLVPDCPEQDDEAMYYEFLRNGSRPDFFTKRVLCQRPDSTPCEKNYEGVCYRRHLHCVYQAADSLKSTTSLIRNTETCRNGGHLKNCALHSCPSFFKCPHAYCVPVYAICNGKVDCPNGEDEKNCPVVSCPGHLLCRDDNVCVHPYDVWAGNVKCPASMDDKALYDIGACPLQCECLGNAIMCTFASTLHLPSLPASTRILIIRNVPFTLNDLVWKEDAVALLHLEITSCNISSVKKGHFMSLNFLRHLILHNNLISFLPARVFQTLPIVEEIDLSHNLISELHSGIFQGSSEVQIIKLNANKLTFLAPCTFQEVKHLRVLDLSSNDITKLGENIFCHSSQASIKELYISGNHIQNINRGVIPHMQNLMYLNVTPLQICCFLPHVRYCYPKVTFYLSTCRNFLGLAFRCGVMVSGVLILLISLCSAIWIYRRIIVLGDRTKSGKSKLNVNNILNLLLFICHGFQGIHLITISCVDIVFHGYYALYAELWRRHSLCVLLNMFSYLLVMLSMFVSLLTARMRMIACVYPFKLSTLPISRLFWAIGIFLCVLLAISYIPYSGIGQRHLDDPHMTLGFGLLLPAVQQGQLLWTLLYFVFPSAVILGVSAAFQTACVYTLVKKQKNMKRCLQTSADRRGAIARCIAAMALPTCCQMPLMCLHIASVSDVAFSPHVAVAATVLTLLSYPIVNAVLFVAITPAFVSYALSF